MYCKIQNDKIIYPPKNFKKENGEVIFNYNLNTEQLIKDGFTDMTDQAIAQFNDAHKEEEKEEQQDPVVFIRNYRFSKLKLKEKLVELGLWENLKLSMSEDDWQSFLLADNLSFDNNAFMSAYLYWKVSVPNIDEILYQCRNDK